MQKKYKLGLIGFGNMANAIALGVLKNQVLSPNQILVFDPEQSKLDYAKSLGLNISKDNQEIADSCDFILLAIKPQASDAVLQSIIFKKNVLISIMAGIKKIRLEQTTGCTVARIMPNTPAMIGLGMSVLDCSGLSELQKEFVFNIFNSVGETIELKESLMDAVTSVSGSGPAYVYLFINGIFQAGIRQGLPKEISKKLAVQTFIGASALVNKSEDEIEILIDKVCSKGGTTIEAVKVFKDGGIDELCNRAVTACYNRSKELSEK